MGPLKVSDCLLHDSGRQLAPARGARAASVAGRAPTRATWPATPLSVTSAAETVDDNPKAQSQATWHPERALAMSSKHMFAAIVVCLWLIGIASTGPAQAQIAFSSNQAGPKSATQHGNAFDIWVMNDDASHQTRLTSGYDILGNSCRAAFSPTLSPDGTRIAYLAELCPAGDPEYGPASIHIMNDNGTGDITVAANPSFSYSSLSWSPDGTRLAYLSNNINPDAYGVSFDIHVVSAAGAHTRVAGSN